VGNTPTDSAIASEGLSLLAVPMAGCLVAFGGYNGRYHNAVHVYRPEGYVVVRAPGVSGGGVGGGGGGIANGTASRAHGAAEAGAAPTPGAVDAAADLAKAAFDLEAARREAAAAKESVSHEMAIMRRQLDSALAAQAAAEKNLDAAKEALEGEQAKSMRLEVEIASLRQQLAGMGELERELERHRQRTAQQERRGPGLWGYITGGDGAGAAPS
jgi:hypothetical protein